MIPLKIAGFRAGFIIKLTNNNRRAAALPPEQEVNNMSSRSEATKKAQARYAKKNAGKGVTRGYYLKCHTVHDADIIAALEAQENKNGYIKELIRADLARQG